MWSALLHIQHSYDVKREMQKKQHIQGWTSTEFEI